MKHDDFSRILSSLSEVYYKLDLDSSDELYKILTRLLKITDGTLPEKERFLKLIQISNYVKRKFDELDPNKPKQDLISLRNLRGMLAHGNLNIKPIDIRKYSTMLWRAISRSADRWDPMELSNFLAYCIDVPTAKVDPYSAGSKRIINIYKANYNALDENRKIGAIEELVMRIYSDPQMRRKIEYYEER